MEKGKVVLLCTILNCLINLGYANVLDSLYVRSNRALNEGRVHDAKVFAYEALQYATNNGNAAELAYACYHLANTFQASDNYESAGTYYQKALELADLNRESRLAAKVLTTFGAMRTALSDFRQGEENINQAIQIAMDIRDTGLLANAYLHLGMSKSRQAEHEQALEHYQRSLQYAQLLDIGTLEAAAYHNAAQASEELGRIDQAIDYMERAIAKRIELKDNYFINEYFINLNYIQVNSGRFKEALRTSSDYYQTLDQLAMLPDSSALEPHAFILDTAYHSVMELDRNYSLAQESLKIAEEKLTSLKYWLTGLSAFILVMLTALVALFRRQARIKDSRKASTVIPAVNDPSPGGGMPNTEAPVEAPKPPEISLAERIQPLMEVDIQMAACYTMLSVDVSVIKISKALKCSRKQVYDFIERIGRIYGIEKDDVRADALKYGKSRNDNPKAKS